MSVHMPEGRFTFYTDLILWVFIVEEHEQCSTGSGFMNTIDSGRMQTEYSRSTSASAPVTNGTHAG